jgi:prepilin-type N-terminal cleavage/methylation domain-containing protein
MIKHLLRQAGFTMIELLVVISVIGVLAVAVLSSINPIEQINKGRDTRTRSDAAQTINAVDRFFATQEKYPWNDGAYACGIANAASCDVTGDVALEDPAATFPEDFAGLTPGVCEPVGPGVIGEGLCQVDGTGGLWLEALGEDGTAELKGGFIPRVQSQTTYAIYVYKPLGTASAMYACFRPSSLAFQAEALRNCKDANIVAGWDATLEAAACPGTGTPGDPSYTQSANQAELICLP